MRAKQLFIHLLWFVVTMIVLVWLAAFLLLTFLPEQRLTGYELRAAWLNQRYDHQMSSHLTAFRAGNTRYSHVNGVLFQETSAVLKATEKPVGAVLIGQQQLIAMKNQLWAFQEKGQQMKQLSMPFESEVSIRKVGLHYGLPVLKTTQGMWRGDPETWSWEAVELFGVSWSEPVSAPTELIAKTDRRVTLKQLLNDVISGRILLPRD